MYTVQSIEDEGELPHLLERKLLKLLLAPDCLASLGMIDCTNRTQAKTLKSRSMSKISGQELSDRK